METLNQLARTMLELFANASTMDWLNAVTPAVIVGLMALMVIDQRKNRR